jgi:hypothetical protein
MKEIIMSWISVEEQLPERDVAVWTKIDDGNGERSVCMLCLGSNGRLWWTPSGDMYVYYTPTVNTINIIEETC